MADLSLSNPHNRAAAVRGAILVIIPPIALSLLLFALPTGHFASKAGLWLLIVSAIVGLIMQLLGINLLRRSIHTHSPYNALALGTIFLGVPLIYFMAKTVFLLSRWL
jgi:undecaprenyl pyrophosphate phosphatase UppP